MVSVLNERTATPSLQPPSIASPGAVLTRPAPKRIGGSGLAGQHPKRAALRLANCFWWAVARIVLRGEVIRHEQLGFCGY